MDYAAHDDNQNAKRTHSGMATTRDNTRKRLCLSVKEYKKLKGLKKENLRDNMTNIELVLNMLAEVTTTELSQKEKPETFNQNKAIAKRGGKFAGETRQRYEKELGRKIISPTNASNKKLLEVKNKKMKNNKSF